MCGIILYFFSYRVWNIISSMVKKIHKRQSIYSCDVHVLENALLFNPPANVPAIGTEERWRKKQSRSKANIALKTAIGCKRNRIIRFESRVCFRKFNFSLRLLDSDLTIKLFYFFFNAYFTPKSMWDCTFWFIYLFFHLICTVL